MYLKDKELLRKLRHFLEINLPLILLPLQQC